MPMSLEEYQVAQMYMVMKMQQQNTQGDEGVEVLENKPFEDDELGKVVPLSKSFMFLYMAAIANFPPRSVIKCPYFSRFILTIETIHKEDNGLTENAHCLTKEQLASRQVEMIDIANDTSDYWSLVVGRSNFDFSQFQSARTGRGPLLDEWEVLSGGDSLTRGILDMQDHCNPVMTAYKLVTIDAPYWGFGSRLEQALLAGERALFLESHRNCFGWIDEWFGLSAEMMRELEKQSDSSLNKKLGRPCLVEDEEDSDDM
ncbi:phosphatidylinositol transfer protein 1-like [Dorcoceras hygrometricum]|uniref:Phosphatidylinositol transfer protein 1-like n=1 Tax=Dorcoceras hygrometricum TaxID=472368 RepID=A0A2Z7CP45_9LAMI|nr:phosphatidylinositol transfer protein 1-like [Dorcoceras hygrometricum]